MNKLISSDRIYVSNSKIAVGERGVFAKEDIKKEDIIEICPIIEFSEHDSTNFKESNLVTYTYYFGKEKDKATILLGFGSIYNHSYKPNAIYIKKNMTVKFTAMKDIKKDEEILVNYIQDIKDNKLPLWFE